ncbi:hypothetical protein [Methylohalobius crimeensis]|uniref:hypothetical protein n=1 Tax=Methylohalobius crimeensis TaxID=244365 RepID=UPI0003B48333|nr:hypothetical protein [Methylohalobius crimeensis]
MFAFIHNLIVRQFNQLVLSSYRWQRRRCLYLGEKVVQWQDPLSLLWYSENTALQLVKARALDEFPNK